MAELPPTGGMCTCPPDCKKNHGALGLGPQPEAQREELALQPSSLPLAPPHPAPCRGQCWARLGPWRAQMHSR